MGGPDECWNWLGSTISGYGSFSLEGAPKLAHRIAFAMSKSEPPADAMVLHSCDNRSCCNPHHLRLGSARDNALDMVSRGRHWTQNGGAQYQKTEGAKRSITRESKKLSADDVLRMRQMYAAGGMSQTAVGRQFGVDSSAAQAVVTGAAYPDLPGPITLTGHKRLTPLQRHIVRHMRMSGEYLETIAREVGVAVSSIQRYCQHNAIAPIR